MSKNNIHVLSRGVIIDQDHILLAYDPRPHPNHYYELNAQFYYLPGGHVDFQESAECALIREIYEETGAHATIEQCMGMIEHAWTFPGDDVCCHTHEMNLIFKIHCTDLSFPNAIQQKESHVAFKWVALDALHNIDLRPLSLKAAVMQWLQDGEKHMFWCTIQDHSMTVGA